MEVYSVVSNDEHYVYVQVYRNCPLKPVEIKILNDSYEYWSNDRYEM